MICEFFIGWHWKNTILPSNFISQFTYPKFATNEQGTTLYKGYKLNLVLMEAEIDATVLMEAEMGRRLGGQHWVPTARWPQAVPLSATTCELDTRCLLATRQIFYCCPHQLTSTANHCRQLPQSVEWLATVAATTANNRHLALKLSNLLPSVINCQVRV